MTPKLWTLEEVANFLSLGLTQARKATAQPDFPPQVKLWQGAHPRLESTDVIEWMRTRKEAA